MHKSLLLRMGHALEEGRVAAFYAEWDDPFVREREPETELVPAIEAGAVFIVEELDFWTAQREIVAASAVFDPRYGISPLSRQHWELGASLVAPKYRRLRLHSLLHRCRLLHVALRARLTDRVFGSLNPANAPSKKSAEKIGFTSWKCPDPAQLKPCGICPKRNTATAAGRACCVDFIRLTDCGAYQRAAEDLLRGDRVLKRKGTAHEAMLYIDLPFLAWEPERQQLAALATQGLYAGIAAALNEDYATQIKAIHLQRIEDDGAQDPKIEQAAKRSDFEHFATTCDADARKIIANVLSPADRATLFADAQAAEILLEIVLGRLYARLA